MNIVAFAASSSTKSINKKLVSYAASLLPEHSVEILDLNDYELPMFSEDKEAEVGQPDLAKHFINKIEAADAIIISFAEHNGFYTVAYKNIFDWCSRIKPKLYKDKAMVLLATSPGGRGAKTVLETAINSIPRFGGEIKASFSLPSFYDNFDANKNIISHSELDTEFKSAVMSLI